MHKSFRSVSFPSQNHDYVSSSLDEQIRKMKMKPTALKSEQKQVLSEGSKLL